MQAIREDMEEFRRQLGKGSIQRAYRALFTFMTELQRNFRNTTPDYGLSSLYHGYLDMTYFALFPESLRRRGLKIAVVFNYGAFRFETWLAAGNRKVQQKYWRLFRDSHWQKYRVVTPSKGVDSIVEFDSAEEVDFSDTGRLAAAIEKNTVIFITDIECFLSDHPIV